MVSTPYTAMLLDETEKRGHLLVCDQMLLTLVCLDDPCRGVTQVSVDSFSLSSFSGHSANADQTAEQLVSMAILFISVANIKSTKRTSEHVFASALLTRATRASISCEQMLI